MLFVSSSVTGALNVTTICSSFSTVSPSAGEMFTTSSGSTSGSAGVNMAIASVASNSPTSVMMNHAPASQPSLELCDVNVDCIHVLRDAFEHQPGDAVK